MRQSHFVNPNGLHHDQHVSSAQDMAILARALLLHFPQQEPLYGIGALKLGAKIIPTHNGLLGRYPGADGMKTGFVCASGFNVVASASRGGRRLVTIVMGSPNAKARTLKAMALFEAGFSASASGRTTLAQLPPSGIAEPPNLRSQICGPNRNRNADEDYAIPIAGLQNTSGNVDEGPAAFFMQQRQQSVNPALVALATGELGPRPVFQPVPVYIGRAPGWAGASRQALTDEAADPETAAAPRGTARACDDAGQSAQAAAGRRQAGDEAEGRASQARRQTGGEDRGQAACKARSEVCGEARAKAGRQGAIGPEAEG